MRAQAERASRAAAESGDGRLRTDFDRMLAAAVAAREEQATRMVQDAMAAADAAEERAKWVAGSPAWPACMPDWDSG